MKTYFQKSFAGGQRAFARLVQEGPRLYALEKIYVDKDFRGLGHGSRILKEVLAEADQEGVTLILVIVPDGGLTDLDLDQWYRRHGFRLSSLHCMYQRKPKKLKAVE